MELPIAEAKLYMEAKRAVKAAWEDMEERAKRPIPTNIEDRNAELTELAKIATDFSLEENAESCRLRAEQMIELLLKGLELDEAHTVYRARHIRWEQPKRKYWSPEEARIVEEAGRIKKMYRIR